VELITSKGSTTVLSEQLRNASPRTRRKFIAVAGAGGFAMLLQFLGMGIPLARAVTLTSNAVIASTIGPNASQQHTIPAVASDTVALLAATQTLMNKTLTSPTIGDFTNAQHNHQAASGGGTLVRAAISDFTHGSAQHDATSLDTTAKLLAQNIRPTYNRLAGVTATFSTFDTNPSNPENMTDGDWTTETGYGTKSLAGVSGNFGNIYFDMGAPYPVLITARVDINRSSGDGSAYCIVNSKVLSEDSYQSSGYANTGGKTTDTYYPFMPVFAYARYINLTFYTSSVTVNPSVFNVKVAEVMALQLF